MKTTKRKQKAKRRNEKLIAKKLAIKQVDVVYTELIDELKGAIIKDR